MSDPARPDVVVVNESGTKPPVVFFHTWLTETRHKHTLGAFLGPDQPLYGIEPPRPEDGPLPTSTAAWVEFHRRQLKALPVSPPYRLAGFSFGGVVALELARQLRAEGVEVEWLGLIDTLRPTLNPKGRRYVTYHLGEALHLPEEKRREYVRKVTTASARRTAGRFKSRVFRLLVRLHLTEPRPPKLEMPPLKRAVWISYLTYDATPYDAPVALFAGAENRKAAADDPSLRWSHYLRGGFEVTPIDGPHLELFSPEHVASVGGALRASLERVDARLANG